MNPQALNRYSYCLNNPLKYIDPSGHDLYDSEGNNIEYTDNVIRAVGLLQIYGYTVDINIGELMTEEYIFVNDLRILEAQGEIEPGTVDRYIEDKDEWIVRPTKREGMEITKYYEVGPGGYFDLNLTFIPLVGITGGVMYDATGWHPYIGVGFGWSAGVSLTTSGDPLTSGMNFELGGNLVFIGTQWGYSAYTDEDYHQWGVYKTPTKLSPRKWGLSVTAFYVWP